MRSFFSFAGVLDNRKGKQQCQTRAGKILAGLDRMLTGWFNLPNKPGMEPVELDFTQGMKIADLKLAEQLIIEHIEIICNGTGLQWPQMDEDLSVTGILEGRF
jgi:hypothetical protein